MPKQKQKKRKSAKIIQPYAWFPKTVDPKLIPAITSLGKRVQKLIVSEQSFQVKLGTETPLSALEVTAQKEIASRALIPLAVALGQGPKLFVLPTELIDHLNQVDLPIAAKDFCPPFGTCIVKSRETYQIISQIDGVLTCTAFRPDGKAVTVFLHPDQQIEARLASRFRKIAEELESGGYRVFESDEDFVAPQQFRATLNFLLLVTQGGFARTARSATLRRNNKKPLAHNPTRPEVFELQNIKLWRQRLEKDTKIAELEGTGDSKSATDKKKRIHWRRAHWRHVAVGEGRIKRDLRFFKATLVNKSLAPEDFDPSKTEYRAE